MLDFEKLNDAGYIPRPIHKLSRLLFDRGIALRVHRHYIRESFLKVFNKIVAWFLGVVPVKSEQIIHRFPIERSGAPCTYLLRNILENDSHVPESNIIEASVFESNLTINGCDAVRKSELVVVWCIVYV